LKFIETIIPGVYIIELEPVTDQRGFFARTWCSSKFAEHGLCGTFVQNSISYNYKKGTLRGMHYQSYPHEEEKLISCNKGVIYDVAVDLRSDSITYRKWTATELSAENRKIIYIPKGVAHGFQTLSDDSEVFYSISQYYHPESAHGIRWDDPAFSIEWPYVDQRIISDQDKSYTFFR
jgi:dTDP-4-dehydrorhamnose 3,5-epimerase